jgi:hypothetical protein
MRSVTPFGLLVWSVTALVAAAPARADTDIDTIYEQIKRLEGRMPVPEPVGATRVGRFNARTGMFQGRRSRIEYHYFRGKPRRFTVYPQVDVNGVQAVLTFRLTRNRTTRIRVVANGVRRTAVPGRSRISVNIGRARYARWTLRAGQHTVSDGLRIARPPVVGAGAFVIEAIPVAIVYEPPQPANPVLQNRATHTRTQEIGTRIQTALTHETATTTFSTTPEFATTGRLEAGMRALSQGLAAVKDERARAAAKGLNSIAGVLGKAERSEEGVVASVRNDALEVRMARTDACVTNDRLGPGAGDKIVVLQTARVVWVDDGTRTRLALLGADYAGCKSIRGFQRSLTDIVLRGAKTCLPDTPATRRGDFESGPQPLRPCRNGMSADTIKGLLALDPFVAGGASVQLPRGRYRRCQGIIGTTERTYSVQVTNEQTQTSTKTTVLTDDFSKSLLSFIGLGPSETKRVTTTISTSSSTSFRTGSTVETKVVIEGSPAGTDLIDVFYDRIFGTFALQPVVSPVAPMALGGNPGSDPSRGKRRAHASAAQTFCPG